MKRRIEAIFRGVPSTDIPTDLCELFSCPPCTDIVRKLRKFTKDGVREKDSELVHIQRLTSPQHDVDITSRIVFDDADKAEFLQSTGTLKHKALVRPTISDSEEIKNGQASETAKTIKVTAKSKKDGKYWQLIDKDRKSKKGHITSPQYDVDVTSRIVFDDADKAEFLQSTGTLKHKAPVRRTINDLEERKKGQASETAKTIKVTSKSKKDGKYWQLTDKDRESKKGHITSPQYEVDVKSRIVFDDAEKAKRLHTTGNLDNKVPFRMTKDSEERKRGKATATSKTNVTNFTAKSKKGSKDRQLIDKHKSSKKGQMTSPQYDEDVTSPIVFKDTKKAKLLQTTGKTRTTKDSQLSEERKEGKATSTAKTSETNKVTAKSKNNGKDQEEITTDRTSKKGHIKWPQYDVDDTSGIVFDDAEKAKLLQTTGKTRTTKYSELSEGRKKGTATTTAKTSETFTTKSKKGGRDRQLIDKDRTSKKGHKPSSQYDVEVDLNDAEKAEISQTSGNSEHKVPIRTTKDSELTEERKKGRATLTTKTSETNNVIAKSKNNGKDQESIGKDRKSKKEPKPEQIIDDQKEDPSDITRRVMAHMLRDKLQKHIKAEKAMKHMLTSLDKHMRKWLDKDIQELKAPELPAVTEADVQSSDRTDVCTQEAEVCEVIKGNKIYKMKSAPVLREVVVERTIVSPLARADKASIEPSLGSKSDGILYKLSDRKYLNNGWTQLPNDVVMRKVTLFQMYPAPHAFGWLERNRSKGRVLYRSGEELALFDENGTRLYYLSGELAMEYYKPEETNAGGKRVVVYSTGKPEASHATHARPLTVLATFDYGGNGEVYDHAGRLRLKYTQNDGITLDPNIGPHSHWKWHNLNDPPVLKTVSIDKQLLIKDPRILKLAHDSQTPEQSTDEKLMKNIEAQNIMKDKQRFLKKYIPFQIKMRAIKVNENFSLKIHDQSSIFLSFSDGRANVKINVGMILDRSEVVGEEFMEVGEVHGTEHPAGSGSVESMQRVVQGARAAERARVLRERRLSGSPP